MIDRGVDYRHPDFLDENGHTRLAYIYDMLDPSGLGTRTTLMALEPFYLKVKLIAHWIITILPCPPTGLGMERLQQALQPVMVWNS